MWWMVGGVLIAAATVRWITGRNEVDRPLDRSEQVQRAYAEVRHGRRVTIASATDGPVVFRGKVSAEGAPLVTRLGQQPCVFSDLRVDDLTLLGPPQSYGRLTGQPAYPTTPSTVVLRERHVRPFLITDETGTAEVRIDDVADVSFVIAPHLSLQGRQLRASEAGANALSRLGLAPFRGLVVTEAAIFVGDTITIAGMGMREVSPSMASAGYREVPMRFVVRGGTNSVMAILKKRG
jgi:hypothetical protein